MILLSGRSQLGSIAEVVAMLIAFVIILLAAYYVTKYFGKAMTGSNQGGNIHVIETVRIAPEKYLQIVEVGGRYFLLSLSKNNLSLISELKEEEVKLKCSDESKPKLSFQDILKKTTKK